MAARGVYEEMSVDISMENTVQLARPTSRFVETLKQSLFALSFIFGSLLAGSMLFKFLDVFSSPAWVLILYPSILSMRGVILGLFSGRLSTGLHLGTVKASFTRNTRYFYLLLYATITLTLQGSLMMGTVASLLSIFFWGTPLTDVVSIFSVIITTMNLSILLVSPVTLAVSVLAFRYGLDPDIIVYPVMSTVADVIDTVCFILTLELLFSSGYLGSYLVGLLELIFLFLLFYIVVKYRKETEFAPTLKEFFLTLVVVTFIVNITGNVLGRISQVITGRWELYIVYPALISTVGAVGSIVGSTATTRLALGTIKSSFAAIKRNIPEIGGACTSSAILFVFFSVISSYLTHGILLFNELVGLVAMLLTLNLLAAPFMSVVAYGVAVLTYRRGLNPDNFVIPFESSLSDSVTTMCLLIVINLFRGISGGP